MCALVLAMLAAPAYADFAALGRSTQHGGIIYDVSSAYYFGQYGTALTELSIAALPTEGYGKTGLTADGNTRLILRYQASSAGSVTFSLSQNITGAALEPLTARQALTSPVRTTQLGTVHQASAVLTAPETWPSGMTYPRDSFTVTATFTPDEGEAVREELTLTLHAPSVVLIHGVFCNNARTFGYDDADGNSGVWRKLENAGLNVISWNYDATKGTSAIINGSNNPLARTLTDAFDALNAQGIASTRADIVAHSMGGLVARQFLRNDIDTGNKSDLSYKQGMIRRVVTIGAPNTGSPIASYLTGKFESISSAWQTWQAKNLWENLQVLLKYFAFQKYKAEDAMAEMANNSDFIAQLGYPAVPFHSIYGRTASDSGKLNEVIDKFFAGDTVALKGLTWLPQQFVDILTSSKAATIGTALASVSDQIRIKELFSVMFDSQDHDLCVSEKSAADIFPAYATTAFEGIVNHNHIMLCKQDDVSSRVLGLLRGGTENFMISEISASEYDRAFSRYVSRAEASMRASEDDLSMFIDDSLSISAGEVTKEDLNENRGGAYSEYDIEQDGQYIQSVPVLGSSAQEFSDDVYIIVRYGEGSAKFFKLSASNSKSFAKDLLAGGSDSGILSVLYCTVQDGKFKVSPAEKIVIAPILENVSGINIPSKKIYVGVSEDIVLNLIASTPNGNYDIAAPAFGIATWTVSNPEVARVTDEGMLSGLKAGTTTLTASAEGFTASVNVEVLSSSNGETSQNTGTPSSDPGSSGGGCNGGITALAVISVLAVLVRKTRA